MPRVAHNTNSPNYVRLDYNDINIIMRLFEETPLTECTEDELVTYERLKVIRKFMEDKYQSRQRRVF